MELRGDGRTGLWRHRGRDRDLGVGCVGGAAGAVTFSEADDQAEEQDNTAKDREATACSGQMGQKAVKDHSDSAKHWMIH